MVPGSDGKTPAKMRVNREEEADSTLTTAASVSASAA